MTDVISIKKKENENPNTLYRRFIKIYRTSRIQSNVKKKRFFDRKISKNVQRKNCLGRLQKQIEFEENYRLGKITTRKHIN